MLTRRTLLRSMLAGAVACLMPWKKAKAEPDFGDNNSVLWVDENQPTRESRLDKQGDWWERQSSDPNGIFRPEAWGPWKYAGQPANRIPW